MAVIDRGLIIRREGNKRSFEYAQECAASLERNNTPHEFIQAVENLPATEAAEAVGMKLPQKKPEGTKNTVFDHPECLEMGNACCTASHIKAWKRIVEIGAPCAVLEHDAYVLRNFRNFQVRDDHLFFLGPRMRDTKTYVPKSRVRRLIQIPQAIGTHGYAITPKTAERLLKDIGDKGLIYGVDWYLFMGNECKLPIIAADPYPLVCWSRESTMGDHRERADVIRGVWSGQNDQNVFGSVTPGLLEGLGCPVHV